MASDKFVSRGGEKLESAIVNLIDSPILGGWGNKEFLLYLKQI